MNRRPRQRGEMETWECNMSTQARCWQARLHLRRLCVLNDSVLLRLPLYFDSARFFVVTTTGQQASTPCSRNSSSHADSWRLKVRLNFFKASSRISNSLIFSFKRSRTCLHSSTPPVVNSSLISWSENPNSCASLINSTRSIAV